MRLGSALALLLALLATPAFAADPAPAPARQPDCREGLHAPLFSTLDLPSAGDDVPGLFRRRLLRDPGELAALAARFGGKLRLTVLDKDDTVSHMIEDGAKPRPPNFPDEVQLIEEHLGFLLNEQEAGQLLVIASNQAGIPKYITHEQADAVMRRTVEALEARGIRVFYYDYAENWDQNEPDGDRKPAPGMALRLERFVQSLGYEVDWERSWMIGDSGYKAGEDTQPDGSAGEDFSNTDRKFAERVARLPGKEGYSFLHARAMRAGRR